MVCTGLIIGSYGLRSHILTGKKVKKLSHLFEENAEAKRAIFIFRLIEKKAKNISPEAFTPLETDKSLRWQLWQGRGGCGEVARLFTLFFLLRF